jgi:hypothetical protein
VHRDVQETQLLFCSFSGFKRLVYDVACNTTSHSRHKKKEIAKVHSTHQRLLIRFSLFWNVTQRWEVVTNVSGLTYRSSLKTGPTDCPETSVNYQPTMCNIPEEGRSPLHRGARYESRNPYFVMAKGKRRTCKRLSGQHLTPNKHSIIAVNSNELGCNMGHDDYIESILHKRMCFISINVDFLHKKLYACASCPCCTGE